jgi:uncharacterized CHY-type Zn-finger protein
VKTREILEKAPPEMTIKEFLDQLVCGKCEHLDTSGKPLEEIEHCRYCAVVFDHWEPDCKFDWRAL